LLALEALENVMPMLQKKIMHRERERERERGVCVYVSARGVNARCDQELEACDITRQLPGFVRALMF